MHRKRIRGGIFCMVLLLGVVSILFSAITEAQTWTPLPPYNTLWPLWSSTLSPADPVTGLPIPLVSNLSSSTVLPVQPCLTWDPSRLYPFLLYNSPVGLVYYDPVQGVNLWPPNYLIDQTTGLPQPIYLASTYSYYTPTAADWLLNNVQTANLSYISTYPTFALQANPIVLPPVLTSALPGLSTALINLVSPPPALTSLLNAGSLIY